MARRSALLAPPRDAAGNVVNPALPLDIEGVSWPHFKPSRATLAKTGRVATKFPCPYRKQHAVCATAEIAARLDHLFVAQKAQLRLATGLPYFVDKIEESRSARLAAHGRAMGLCDLSGLGL